MKEQTDRLLLLQSIKLYDFFKKVYFWPHHMSCGILVTQPGIKPVLSALEVCGLNHCTVGEVPKVVQLLGKMVLSQQEGLDSSSRRTAPRGFLSQDLLPFSLLLCVCCVLSHSVVLTLQPHGL